MGSAGPPEPSDSQLSFKNASQSSVSDASSSLTQSNAATHPSSHPFSPMNFLPSASYSSPSAYPSTPSSYSLPSSQGAMYPAYLQHPQDLSLQPSHPSSALSHPGFPQATPPSPSLIYPHSTPLVSSVSQLNRTSSSTLDGAHLMALLANHSSIEVSGKDDSSLAAQIFAPPEFLPASSNVAPTMPSAPPATLSSSRLSSSKFPRGRPLKGDYVIYDINERFPGEAQLQLEVFPITVYGSDPSLVLGRQIAVNKSYICYKLRNATIRILNVDSALKALLHGHSQRVTDMVFFAEDVHLLASASSDGRVFVRKIVEELGEDGKAQITEQILLAILFYGDWDSIEPRINWYSHTQDLLVVAVGKFILSIELAKVRQSSASGGFSVEDPVKCHVDNPINGVQHVGGHDADITSIASCQQRYLATSSKDGMVKIWGVKKMVPVCTFLPYEGQPVGAVAFISSPFSSDQLAIITGGSLNRVIKVWLPTSSEGWLSEADPVKWHCVQTLELRNSAVLKEEDAFFNHLLAIPRTNLIIVANAKTNSIYVLHVEYGLNASVARLDYLAEFSVTAPILSLTATNGNVVDGDGFVQLYCVQAQSINQYAIDLLQCSPARAEGPSSVFMESSSLSTVSSSAPLPASVTKEVQMLKRDNSTSSNTSAERAPVSPRLSPIQTRPRSPIELGIGVTSNNLVEQPHKISDTKAYSSFPSISASNAPDSLSLPSLPLGEELRKEQQMHLITPSELMSIVARNKTDVDVGVAPSSAKNVSRGDNRLKEEGEEVEAGKEDTGDLAERSMNLLDKEARPENDVFESNIGGKRALVSHIEFSESEITKQSVVEGNELDEEEEPPEFRDELSNLRIDNSWEHSKEDVANTIDLSAGQLFSQIPAPSKGKKNKNKNDTLGPSAFASSSMAQTSGDKESFNVSNLDSLPSTVPPPVGLSDQLHTLQESLNQLVIMQKELQKKLGIMVSVPVAKEGKRIETVLGQCMEKVLKANVDAMWARIQEDSVKREKVERERMQQWTNLVSNVTNRDLPTVIERALKKEMSLLSPTIARLVTPSIEKAVPATVNDLFQKGIGEKSMLQIEKSLGAKLEFAVSQHLQSSFQTSGKLALQDSLRAAFEGSVIPSFERSCRAMFEQVDASFQKGLAEYGTVAQQQFNVHTTLASNLQDTIASSVSLAASLRGELADGQRKLQALSESAGSSLGSLSYVNKQISGSLPNKAVTLQHVEETLDPTIELARLIGERKLEEAFHKALSLSNIAVVSWLCNQVDSGVLLMGPVPPLSQGVLLSLVQQLGCDLNNETGRKLGWIKDVALALNPNDPLLAPHMRPLLQELYKCLLAQLALIDPKGDLANPLRLVMHIVNSVLTDCK